MAMVMVHSQEDELTAKRDLLLLDALDNHVDVDVDDSGSECYLLHSTAIERALHYSVQCTMYLCPVPVPCVVVVEL